MSRDLHLRVLSLGAGVQSSTLALMIEHGDVESVDFAVFADTQQEPREVYRWLDWLESVVSFPIVRATKGDLAHDTVQLVQRDGITTMRNWLPVFCLRADGSVGMLPRFCSSEFKVAVVKREVSRRIHPALKRRMSTGKAEPVGQLIGISMDEVVRMKPSRVKYLRNTHPLIDLRMTRSDCVDWMRRHNYPEPPRSACVMCPYHQDSEWIKIKAVEEDFARVVDFERTLQRQAKLDERLKGVPYLHKSCVPIDEVTFKEKHKKTTLGGAMSAECEGMCGL